MSAHAVGVFGVGTEPPPDSRLPRLSLVIVDVSASTLARSACVIWPIFSASVILESRSATRCLVDRRGFSYGKVPGDGAVPFLAAGLVARCPVALPVGARTAATASAAAASDSDRRISHPERYMSPTLV